MADLETARLGARVDEIKAAEADVEALTRGSGEGALGAGAEEPSMRSPTPGCRTRCIARESSWRPAVRGFAAAPGNVKVRFFVPQAQWFSVKPGTQVSVSLDGAAPLYGRR